MPSGFTAPSYISASDILTELGKTHMRPQGLP